MGDIHQPLCRMRVRCGGVLQVCKGITLQSVGTALEKNEIGFETNQMLLDSRPGLQKLPITGPRHQRDVELGSLCGVFAGFVLAARAGIKIAAIFVDIGENQIRVCFVGVENPVAVMRVDIHVGDPPDTVLLPQRLDHHAQIVEHAEARGMPAPGVMQSADRLEAAGAFAHHYARQPVEGRADHVCRCFEYSREYGRIAVVENLELVAFRMHHSLDMALGVETTDFGVGGAERRAGPDPG